MPIYEYRCGPCEKVSGIYFRTSTDSPPLRCRHCGSDAVERIFSAFASPVSEADKLSKLDPKYHKQVDAALARAPKSTHPDYHLNKMVPFNAAKEG